jgi:hypothetical protein
MRDLLKEYAEELGISLSLESLIEAHRVLRERALRTNEAMRREMDQAREHARQQAEEEAKKYGWFSAERLRAMTLGELTELLEYTK